MLRPRLFCYSAMTPFTELPAALRAARQERRQSISRASALPKGKDHALPSASPAVCWRRAFRLAHSVPIFDDGPKLQSFDRTRSSET